MDILRTREMSKKTNSYVQYNLKTNILSPFSVSTEKQQQQQCSNSTRDSRLRPIFYQLSVSYSCQIKEERPYLINVIKHIQKHLSNLRN